MNRFILCILLALSVVSVQADDRRRAMLFNRNVTAGGGESLPVSGVGLWIDASQQTGFNDNDSVTAATDFSGNYRHMGQDTSGSRPTFQTAEINSLPIFRFAGTDDCLTNFYAGQTGSMTLFGVVKPTTLAAFRSWTGALSSSGGSFDAYIIGSSADEDQSDFRRAIAGGAAVEEASGASGDLVDGTAYIWVCRVDDASGTAVAQWLNGTAKGTDSGATAPLGSITTTVIGATYFNNALADFFIGDIGEFFIYPSALSTTDINTLGNYLETKWGITWSDIP